ncbi:unnamed protein product [Brassica rapa]|uniref:Uncharacterized protein n=1 Tax=Brassica campestris TaxID=3711 RepID=A0A8D9FXD4_BRACM|nr:unnamed protein product [Brassica rapa]
MSPSKPSSDAFKPVSFVFTRCQVCGGVLKPTRKTHILIQLEVLMNHVTRVCLYICR